MKHASSRKEGQVVPLSIINTLKGFNTVLKPFRWPETQSGLRDVFTLSMRPGLVDSLGGVDTKDPIGTAVAIERLGRLPRHYRW
jgi:hypothetical protein